MWPAVDANASDYDDNGGDDDGETDWQNDH